LLVRDCGQPDAIAISAREAGRRRACQDVCDDDRSTLGLRLGRARHRKSGLPGLRHSIMRKSGKPDSGAIHVILYFEMPKRKTWMPGTRPGMTEQNCEAATSAAGRSSLSACRVSACRVMRPQTAWIREARVYLQVRITLPNCPGACWPVVAVQFLGNGWQPSF